MRSAVRALAEENGWATVEAVAVIAQSYGLRVHFTDDSRTLRAADELASAAEPLKTYIGLGEVDGWV